MADPAGPLPTYTQLADLLEQLPLLLREARRRRGLATRDAAEEMQIAHSTVSRIETGDGCALPTAIAVLRWLDTSAPTKGSTA